MFKPIEANSIQEYLESIPEPRRSEILTIDALIKRCAPLLKPHFAYNMLGYGSFHYKSKSGREGNWPVISLASRKNYISLYVCALENGKYLAELYKDKLTGSSIGKSCIRFKKLSDIDLSVVEEILKKAEEKPGL